MSKLLRGVRFLVFIGIRRNFSPSLSEKIKAYVALVENKEDTYTYTIGKMSPFVMFPLERIYGALNEAEGLSSQDNCWGGSAIIGGSPRKTGSRLTPEKVQKVINGCINREQKA